MSVHIKPKNFRRSDPIPLPAITARSVVEGVGPLHDLFIVWLKDKKPTKAQAAKFLQTYPHYRNPDVVARYSEPKAA